jgi:predicted phosphohydrolase
MRKLFAIGDLHLSFTSEKPMGIFGKNWDDHEKKILERWRAVVGPDDVVFLLGDHSWGLKMEEAKADLTWIHALPGTKVMLKGNHDLWWQSVGKLRGLYADMLFIQNDSVRFGDTALCGTRGWLTPQEPTFKENGGDRKVYSRELIRLRLSLESARASGADTIICGLHFPPSARPHLRSEFMDLIEEFGVKKVCYGHLHGHEAFRKGLQGALNGVDYALVSADHTDFHPHFVAEMDAAL